MLFRSDTIDVILRGDPAAASATVDVTEFWQGKIMLLNVPVHQPGVAVTAPAAR